MSTTADDDNNKNSRVDISSSGDDDDENGTLSGDADELNSQATPTIQNHTQRPVSDIDVDRELLRYDYEDFVHKPDEVAHRVQSFRKPLPISLERGSTGVFDVEELVALLQDENARDICVIRVPKEYEYVDHMVIVTGKSTRHLRAMAEYIKWTYKRKRSPQDHPTVNIEGESTNDWFAIDLGNIAVHLFLRNTRLTYDLETLWTVGVEYDEKSHQQESLTDAQSSMQLEDFSFDAELERLRKLRDVTADSMDMVVDDGNDVVNDRSRTTATKFRFGGMENVASWHRLPDR